jgi:predicted O-linked N-acetylglucosamine transferase (SPINDLY family)
MNGPAPDPLIDLEAAYQFAMAEHRAGRLDVAESLYRQILGRNRFFARAWHLLGLLLHQRGDTATGIEYIERAIGLEPQWLVFYTNLGSIYLSLGHLGQAEQVLRRAIELSPETPEPYGTLGSILSSQNRCSEAIEFFLAALGIKPDDPVALRGLAFAYSEVGLVQESIATYQKAAELSGDPMDRVLAAVQLPLVYESREDVERWRERLSQNLDALLAEQLVIDIESQQVTPIFSLPHQGFNDIEIQKKYARLFRPPTLPSDVWQPHQNGKTRVGFISSYLSLHTIGKLVCGLITRLDPNDFEVTLFSIGRHIDPLARELASSADRYVVLPRDLKPARQAILENSVDILFYTDLGMDQVTYSLAFSRLAPIQCTTWGHPETTGLLTIDYFISSEAMETPGADAYYSERLVRLPSLTFSYSRSRLPEQLADRAAFGLHPAARLYACPQSIYKLHPDFDQALAGILRRDPEGQIVLIQWAYSHADDLLRRRFAAVMPDVADRIVFIPRLQQAQFMNFLTLIDVMLDPFPYGGGNSSLEAFSFGVPVVTLPTEFLRGRITQAVCRRLGVEPCIARDVEDYIDIAVRLAIDTPFQQAIRQQIVAAQPRVFDDESAVRDLERFFREVAGTRLTKNDAT